MAYQFIAFNEDIFAFLAARKNAILSQALSRQLPPSGKVIRVDSRKKANEVRAPAGTRR